MVEPKYLLVREHLKKENASYRKALKKKREEICQLRAVIVKLDHYVNVNRYAHKDHETMRQLFRTAEKLRQRMEGDRNELRNGLGEVWEMALRAAETYNKKGHTLQDLDENFHGLLGSVASIINKLNEIMNS